MSLTISIADYVFVNNPVPVLVNTGAQEVIFEVYAQETRLYQASYDFPSGIGVIEISDILKSIVSAPDPEFRKGVCALYDNFGQVGEYSLKMYPASDPAGAVEKTGLKAVYGGVAKSFLRNSGYGEFFDRLNGSANFTLSTRTNSRFISVRETEIHPVKLWADGRKFTIVSPAGNILTIEPDAFHPKEICVLNLSEIRKYFYDRNDELPAYFTITAAGKFCFQISFIPSTFSAEKCRLKFLNSLGCFELIELTGKSTQGVEFSSEGDTFSVFDSDVYDYVESTKSRKTNATLEARTGYKTADELRFIKDLLISPEIYLLDSSQTHRVLVSCEDYKVPALFTEPGSLTLKLKFADNETNYSPAPDDSEASDPVGEWMLERGIINERGMIYNDSKIK